MTHVQIADDLKRSSELAARYIRILEMKVAHMEGRIRTYLEGAEGMRPQMNLAECIADDLRRIDADRKDCYGLSKELS